ncbi:6599_t:CDS:2, partial [Racocetra persica]
NYKLGVRKNGIFREGEVEEEFDNYNNRIGYRQNVFGQLQGTNGNVGPLQELRAVGTEMNRGFSPEAYEMTPFQLQDIWQEAVKIYYTYYQNHLHELPDGVTGVEDIDINELEKPNIFTFIGGDGDRVGVDSAVVEHIRTNPAFPQVADTSSTGDSHTTSNQQTPPPPPHQQPTIIRDLTFTIDSVGPGYNGNPHYITLSAPLVVEDVDIYLIFIQSNDPLLQDGNRVIIRDVSFGPGQAEVDHFAHDISIKTFFRTIDLVSTTSPPGGGISTPNNPPPPPSFPDVVKKNHDLINEEN